MPTKYGYVDRDGPRDEKGAEMSLKCSHCNKKHKFKASIEDYNKWANGADDIKAFGHYMNKDAKEIAADGMCGSCKEKNMDKVSISNFEPLEKKCPRCGKSSANKSNPSGRCRSCLNKLAANKKKPGHWQRAQTKADDALRRQKGNNGTAHKKHSGLGSRASIVKQVKRAEKKTGQKLSPDRKNNGKGYAASNTRMVPERLNRGRHKVDSKKLKAWRKRLKKSQNISQMSPGGVPFDHLDKMFNALSFHESPPSAHILVRAHRGEDMNQDKCEAVYDAIPPITNDINSSGSNPAHNPDLFHDNETRHHLNNMSPDQFHSLRNEMLDILHERWEAGYDEDGSDEHNDLIRHITNLTNIKKPIIKKHHKENWHEVLKKYSISSDEMYTYVLAKAEELGDQTLMTLLRSVTADDLLNFIKKEDV